VEEKASNRNIFGEPLWHLYITENSGAFSLSPMDSDQWTNLLIMEQLVGTLVKANVSGNFEPYLAEKWETSSDERHWKFQLRQGLFTESKEKINAASFVKSFKKLLKIYAKSSQPPTFSKLEGWPSFISGDSDSLGIRATDELSIELVFMSRPSGVLDFFSMPYFGYYSESDFTDDKWIDSRKITSSGSYKLKSYLENSVIAEIRKDSVFFKENAPKNVEFAYKKPDEIKTGNLKNVIIATRNEELSELANFRKVLSPPTVLSAAVLSPLIPPFNKKENRIAFRTLIREAADKQSERLGILENRSDYFYQIFSAFNNVKKQDPKAAIHFLKKIKVQKLNVFWKQPASKNGTYLVENLLPEIKNEIGWDFAIQGPKEVGKDWIKVTHSNMQFPIRFVKVDTDGAPENWVVDMMFCSNLGVSFPDPQGHICSIVKDYELYKIKSNVEYQKRMSEQLENDAIVVPLAHYGYSWLVERSISEKSFGKTVNVPRFDLMEIEK
jgi:hypothetical protein